MPAGKQGSHPKLCRTPNEPTCWRTLLRRRPLMNLVDVMLEGFDCEAFAVEIPRAEPDFRSQSHDELLLACPSWSNDPRDVQLSTEA
mmetsp:Transcript_160905/g.516418  ORF Transcript_160905/g.516418 Transcript_160905/m.516418 type:complete len:87 (-) Transcript_160905:8-268(-)